MDETSVEPAKKKQKAATPPSSLGPVTIDCVICYTTVRPPAVSCGGSRKCLMCKKCVDRYVEEHCRANPGTQSEDVKCPLCHSALYPLHYEEMVDRIVADCPATCSYNCDTEGLTVSTIAGHEEACEMRTVGCDYEEDGCTWVGQKAQAEAHKQTCKFKERRYYKQLITQATHYEEQRFLALKRKMRKLEKFLDFASVRLDEHGRVLGMRAPCVPRAGGSSWVASFDEQARGWDVCVAVEEMVYSDDPAPGRECVISIVFPPQPAKKVNVDAVVVFHVDSPGQQGHIAALGEVRGTFSSQCRARSIKFIGDLTLTEKMTVALLFKKFDVCT